MSCPHGKAVFFLLTLTGLHRGHSGPFSHSVHYCDHVVQRLSSDERRN